MAAAKGLNPVRAIFLLAQGKRCQLQPGNPALGALLQCQYLCIREREAHRLAEKGAGIFSRKAQIGGADLKQLSSNTPAREGQVRVNTAGDEEVNVCRKVLQPEGEGFMNRLFFDDLIIIQKEQDRC